MTSSSKLTEVCQGTSMRGVALEVQSPIRPDDDRITWILNPKKIFYVPAWCFIPLGQQRLTQISAAVYIYIYIYELFLSPSTWKSKRSPGEKTGPKTRSHREREFETQKLRKKKKWHLKKCPHAHTHTQPQEPTNGVDPLVRRVQLAPFID